MNFTGQASRGIGTRLIGRMNVEGRRHTPMSSYDPYARCTR